VGGDYVRILAREGINLPDEDQISRESFSHTVGDLSFGRGIPERESITAASISHPKGIMMTMRAMAKIMAEVMIMGMAHDNQMTKVAKVAVID